MKSGCAVAITLTVVVCTADVLLGQASGSAEVRFKAAQNKELVEGDLTGAIEQYAKFAQGTDRVLAARALVRMGAAYEKLGQPEARTAYERVVREFADQTGSTATARTRLAALQTTSVIGQTTRLVWSNRRLSTSEAGELSDDGRYLTFSDLSLTLVDLKEGETKTFSPASLGHEKGWVEGSAISPDGRQLAYVLATVKEGARDLDDRTHEIRVFQISDGNVPRSRRVPLPRDFEGNLYLLGWSPTGKEVVVIRIEPQTEHLALVSVADGAVRVLQQRKRRCCAGARLSSDGRFLLYSKVEPGTVVGLYVMTMDGKETRLDVGPGANRNPIWSRDGLHIVFESDRTGTPSLWMTPMMDGRPSGPARLAKEDVPMFSPIGFTRNGALYYQSGRRRANVYTAELDAKLNVVGAPTMATDRYINSNVSGVWSPDGQNQAYVAIGPNGVFIRVRSAKTGEDRQVASPPAVSGPIRWFPDGQSLLVPGRDPRILNGDVGYYRVSILNGDAQLLHRTPATNTVAARPDLSPDGRTIFYLETPSQPARFEIDSGRVTRLTPVGPRVALAVSPDGLQVAYLGMGGDWPEDEASRSAVVVAPATGGEPRTVASFSGNFVGLERDQGLGLAWSPDQRHLFFVRPEGDTGDGSKAVWRVPLTGGAAENIGISLNRIRHLRIHPDGRRISFDSIVDPGSEVWVLESFLPKPDRKK